MSDIEINEIDGNNDDLRLSQTFVPDVPQEIFFPDELNAYLRDQLQYLTHENGMLKKNLAETETKLKDEELKVEALSKRLKQYDDVPTSNNFTSISNIASSKIVELSKKLREKSSELESYKTKYSKLEHELFLLRQKEEERCTQAEDVVPTKLDTDNEDQIKQLTEKLSAIQSKLYEAKNANVQLKNDLKLANKFLQQEIGDSFENLQNLTNSGANWRGRAQIVCDLQQKNIELREKLRILQEKKPDIKIPESTGSIKYDRRIDILSRDNISFKNELQELKKKLDGARARNKALESENSVLKTKTIMFSEQQDNDRDLIATLTSQLSTIKNVQNDDLKQKDQIIMKLQRECKNLHLQLSKENCKFEHLKREYEEKLTSSNRMWDRSERPSSQKNVSVIDEKVIARLEVERVKLLELTDITKKRLEEERRSLLDFQLQCKAERQKNAKLEAKIARLELDHNGKQSTYSLSSSKDKGDECSLRDKLELAEENLKALKTRLEMEQKERQLDFQEFSNILRNYAPTSE